LDAKLATLFRVNHCILAASSSKIVNLAGIGLGPSLGVSYNSLDALTGGYSNAAIDLGEGWRTNYEHAALRFPRRTAPLHRFGIQFLSAQRSQYHQFCRHR